METKGFLQDSYKNNLPAEGVHDSKEWITPRLRDNWSKFSCIIHTLSGSKSRSSASDAELKPLQPLARKPVSTSSSLPSSSQANSGAKDKRRDIPGPLSGLSPSLQKQGKLPPPLFSPTPQRTRETPVSRKGLDNDSPGPTVVLIECKHLFFYALICPKPIPLFFNLPQFLEAFIFLSFFWFHHKK